MSNIYAAIQKTSSWYKAGQEEMVEKCINEFLSLEPMHDGETHKGCLASALTNGISKAVVDKLSVRLED